MYSREQIEQAVKAKGYKWFDDASGKSYDVNIVGIRNSSSGNSVTNVFDDWLSVSFKVSGEWKFLIFPCTTDPGKKGVIEYHNSAGVARLVEGQYRSAYRIGKHQGKYEALTQAKPVKVYRDADRNLLYDSSKTQEGIFGINIHKAGANSTYVENWSEGCQVFKQSADFDEFMNVCRKASVLHGNSFTYTLITTNDLI